MSCSEIQEQLAQGHPLLAEQLEHAAHCPHCSNVAATYSLLEETLPTITARVPADFADRVMNKIAEQAVPVSSGSFDQRWLQVVLIGGGSVLALVNLLRFLANVLIPNLGLGGAL